MEELESYGDVQQNAILGMKSNLLVAFEGCGYDFTFLRGIRIDDYVILNVLFLFIKFCWNQMGYMIILGMKIWKAK